MSLSLLDCCVLVLSAISQAEQNCVTVPPKEAQDSEKVEDLSPLAMWETEVQTYELLKGEAGLGFSILDYQACG